MKKRDWLFLNKGTPTLVQNPAPFYNFLVEADCTETEDLGKVVKKTYKLREKRWSGHAFSQDDPLYYTDTVIQFAKKLTE